MNIIVKYDPYARLGNRIFQYSYAYLLAEKLKRKLYDNEGIPNLGINPNHINQCNNPLSLRAMGNHYVNNDIIKSHSGDIIVDSFLQKSEYYENYRDKLRSVFQIKLDDFINEDSLVVHVRDTDYVSLGHSLGYEFYKKMIDASGFTKVILVTDNSKGNTVQQLLNDGCVLCGNEYQTTFSTVCDSRGMKDFKILLYSANIAISQSTFSWWPAFLGYHKKIIFPYSNNGGMWPVNPSKDSIDLYFDLGQSEKFIL